MILFAIIGYCIVPIIVGLVSIFQFIYTLFVDKPLESLLAFSDSLSRYLQEIAAYLTYVTEDKPFPFHSWPQNPVTVIHKTKK